MKRWINILLNLFLALVVLIAFWLFSQVFLLASFRIPSDSMEPELVEGDFVAVWKPTLGARLFDLNATLRLEQTEIHRTPGFRKTSGATCWSSTSRIPTAGKDRDAYPEILHQTVYRIAGRHAFHPERKVPDKRHERTAREHGFAGTHRATLPGEFPDGVYKAFPFDSVISWNIRNFGPLYVPKAGDKVEMNRENYLLYRKLIAWEQKAEINYNDSTVFLNGEPIREYRFLKNYYFMAGDKGLNSQDSRYWGLLPEEYIVGKAAFVWKSVDPYTGQFRWDRFMKKIE